MSSSSLTVNYSAAPNEHYDLKTVDTDSLIRIYHQSYSYSFNFLRV